MTKWYPVSGEIGRVTASSGFPTVVRNQLPYVLARESRIYPGDVIDTDSETRVTIQFADESRVSIAPDTHFVVHTFERSDDDDELRIKTAFTRGALRVQQTDHATVRREFVLMTPLATITSQAEDLWAGFIFSERTLDAAMLTGSHVLIENRDGTSQLNQPGFGVRVVAGAAPRNQRLWDDTKIEAALSSTNL